MKCFVRLLVLVFTGAMACAVEAAQTIQVVVTSAAGRDVFLDRGRTSGIVTGLRVRFFPAGAASVEGVVVDVSASSARVEMYQGNATPPVGTIGQLEVPEPAPAPAPAGPGATSGPTSIPAHPPWTRQEEPRTPDMPLLAPAFSRSPSERPPTVHGRAFAQYQLTLDQGGDRDSQYHLGRAGTSLLVTNPFRQGGELRIDVEYDRRGQDLTDSGDGSDDEFIINRLSYAIGTEQYSPYRLEAGRFISYYLPEVGLLDGVEGAMRLQNGLNIGAGVGAYPQPFPERDEGDDLGFHVFLDYRSDEPKGFAGTIGYQKTWHEGAADRDQLILRASTWLGESIWLYGAAQLDLYTSSDAIKASGIQVTNAWFQARYTSDPAWGAAISASHFTYPKLKSAAFFFIPAELIKDGRIDRGEVSVWRNIVKDIRATVRGNYFNDQDNDGFGGELDLDWRNVRDMPLDVHGAVFYNQGANTTIWGGRAEARTHVGAIDLFAGYEFNQYTQSDALIDSGDFIRHTVRGGASVQLGRWYLNLTTDYLFGDSENAIILGLYGEYRF